MEILLALLIIPVGALMLSAAGILVMCLFDLALHLLETKIVNPALRVCGASNVQDPPYPGAV